VGSTVTLKTKETDRYGRTIAEVFKGSTSINQAMVGSGMAFVYWQYISGCDRNTYARLEQQARSQKLGVWGPQLGYDLIPPWDYRKCRRSGQCR
jgi:endonuclease YncB( thermonuclease family)